MSIKDLMQGRKDIFKLKFEDIIVVPGRNPRTEFGDIEGLALSLKENGQEQPLKVRVPDNGSKAELVDGERRFRAFTLLKEQGFDLPLILCRNEEKGANEETRLVSMLVCNDGKPLTPIELADAFYRLIQFQFEPAEIAKKVGKSVQYVNSILKLHSAPKKVRNAVVDGELSASAAVTLVEAKPEKQEKILAAAKAQKATGKKRMTVSDVQKETKGVRANVSSKKIRERMQAVQDIMSANGKPEKTLRLLKAVLVGLEIALEQRMVDESLATYVESL